jgi:drug/metabolite transporter (DMT)-like permease
MSKLLLPFLFAFVAALGNVFYVLASRKTEVSVNPFLFTAASMAVCAALFVAAYFLFDTRGTGEFLRRNGWWAVLSGAGIFLTFYGFYLLYSRFDTSYYTLFAVLSLVMTTVLLGWWFLKEGFNLYGVLSVAAALVSIVFFGLSKR